VSKPTWTDQIDAGVELQTSKQDTTELYYAEMESARNTAEAAYFTARPLLNEGPPVETFRAGFERAFRLLWKPATGQTSDAQLHHRPEVMNPPQSAAEGCEAGNLNTGQRHGLGASPRAAEARPAEVAPLPSFGDPCPCCASGKIGQSGYDFRCANCGWLGSRVPWAPVTVKTGEQRG